MKSGQWSLQDISNARAELQSGREQAFLKGLIIGALIVAAGVALGVAVTLWMRA